ncbi:acyl carrier protein [Pseudoflavitalea sp. G-6-1-2]|uniref:acyl carrier protein n=1 Tax=Pseudoflavitalea sp. G-6-1-2 TaxID=2728841 RepID=UPI00146DDED2|nr:acyl carrier protein [Pseudoflavitalea sp. G-6-1-2]NML20456.1 acyl carrier protein [Pseudoflavitalea sp. G-6-1-2]
MEQQQILEQLNEIFIDVLDNSDIKLTEATTANDIEEWDSLYHIQLVVAIEKHYKVKFTASEIQSWKNVGDMANAVKSKLGA